MLTKVQTNNAIIITLSLLTAFCFYRTFSFEFINFDDNMFVYLNQNVLNGLSLKSITWAFTTTHMEIWHPLTWLSHIIDCQLFGLNAGAHHLSSVFLHLINSILLFYIIKSLTNSTWKSAFVAVLFAIHPLHVEPVAWISIRKDLLSTLFVFLSIQSYIKFVNNSIRKYFYLTTLYFAMALLSKPIVIYVPFLLLLLDYWPLARLKTNKNNMNISNLVKEKIAWFAMSALILFINFKLLSKVGAIATSDSLPLSDRVSNVPFVIFHYMTDFVYPLSLSVFYPYPKPLNILLVTSGIIILFLITFLFIKFRQKKPYLLFGWFWFLITLLPVLGLVQQAQHLVADRYMYLPLIGLSIIFAWGTNDLFKKIIHVPTILSSLSVIIIIACLTLSIRQTTFWENNFTLYNNAIEVTENNHVAHTNIGAAYLKVKNYEKSAYHYAKAIEMKPYFSKKDIIYLNFYLNKSYTENGMKYLSQSNDSLALKYFLSALLIDNSHVANNYNVGNIYLRTKDFDQAIKQYKRVIELNKNYPDAYYNLAIAQVSLGNYDEAEQILISFLDDNKGDYIAAYNLACVYALSNKPVKSVKRLNQSLKLGFDKWDIIKSDSELDIIRNSKEFISFLKKHNQL